MKKLVTILFAIVVSSILNAQELNLEEAIRIALSNNYGIIIAQQEEAAFKTDIHPGAVGLLPTVDANGAGSYSYSSTNQEFNGGIFPAIEGMEASQNSQSAKVSASYLLFNGGSRIKLYSKLKASGDLSEIQTKITIESTLVQVVNAYYEVVRVHNQLELVKSSLNLSRDRLGRIEINHEYGNTSKIDVLNAQVDFNSDSSNYVNTELKLRQSKNELNFLLGRKIATEFNVNEDVELPNVREVSEYIKNAKENNTLVMLSNIQLNMAEMDKKISTSNFMPILSTNLDYGYSGSASDVGVFKSASSIGYTGSVSLKWNLFDGFKKQRALEKAKINIEVNTNKKQQTLLNIEKEVQNYYDALSHNIRLLNLENQNKVVAKINLERSKDLLNNGSITSFQFRQAQLNLLQIENRINNLNYAIKVYDYQLLRMTNELVK
ncbi:MAG: TolC family protein [Flavobacteriales bacterium]